MRRTIQIQNKNISHRWKCEPYIKTRLILLPFLNKTILVQDNMWFFFMFLKSFVSKDEQNVI